MSTDSRAKINQLLNTAPKGAVLLSSWLQEKGYSSDLQKRYRKSDWLKAIGTGAMIRSGDQVDYTGGLFALQYQADMSVHVGGRSAFSLLGRAHYLELDPTRVILFGQAKEKIPTWFSKQDWALKLDYYATSFLPPELGLTELELKTFSIKVSAAERAMLECLYLAPKNQSLLECAELMEGLNNLRPRTIQKLLESCNSVKVKRLFLFLAERAGHSWFKHIDIQKLELGSGKRSIVPAGTYIPKYEITVPKELASDEHSGL
ncbi:type IV toxin-antitoxin system AbiEi family antitoxin [Pseudovibrio exalbescens]|uniref:type IV toxin-antitoxin system AbiEi family antitoxin n=1 Tax=Pseudovibrio exalbescens TaxID=197461 RepID=UPI000C9C1CC2|nr:type IV toxin-antitoxin system AbiEi family antitoxin [Pseudovibrio exalbescens]